MESNHPVVYFHAMKILDNEGDPDWCKGMDCAKELKGELVKQYKERLMKEIEYYSRGKSVKSKIKNGTWKQMRSYLSSLKGKKTR